jgi:dihydrofolate reductase
MEIAAIVAMSQNNVIGKNNQLPWHLPADLQYFKKITSNHAILMGRITYESIGKPLPNRYNLVLSSQANYLAEGCTVVTNITQAIQEAKNKGYEKLFVIGGGKVYHLAFPYIQRWYVTAVYTTIEQGDALLELPMANWQKVNEVFRPKDEKNAFDMSFLEYVL